MSDADREKWDERFRAGAYADREHPTALLAELEPSLPRGRALDVACGAGRNALFLAATGRDVDAVDISTVGLERAAHAAAARGLTLNLYAADLEADPHAALPPGPYALIVLVRYVHRGILEPLLARLESGGMLLCEQHVDSDADVVGPSNPAFRMRSNELLRQALAAGGSEFRVRFYREGVLRDPDGRDAALAQLLLARETPA